MNDCIYMQRAVVVGEQARLLSPPNPWVGCLIVKDNHILGEGYTQAPGQAHAEIMALQQARDKSKGATVYVTLEPCHHFGRTPPCTHALIKAGVKRVVIALIDPDPLVCGQGLAALKEAGIEVVTGVCADVASQSLRPYLYHRQTKKPYCVLKAAVSIDGRTAAKDGSSWWITSCEARADAHRLRSHSQAILVGSGTALADYPALTVRDVPQPLSPPLRIVWDRRGRVPAKGPLFDTKLAKTLMLTSTVGAHQRAEEWQAAGAAVKILTEEQFEIFLLELGARGIIQLMVEGGATLQAFFLQNKFCHELVVYTGNLILGDEGWAAFNPLPIATMAKSIPLFLQNTAQFGQSTRAIYYMTDNIKFSA